MLIVKKGESLRRFTKGLMPFLVVIGVLDVLAALEPDLSVAMLFTLLMALLLFVGGARMGHFIALGAMCLPVFVAKIEKWRYALSRITAFLHPGNAPETVSFQLNQSLIAVGSGGWFGRGFGEGMQQAFFVPFPVQRFRRRATSARSGVSSGSPASRSRSRCTRCSDSASRARRGRRSCSSWRSGSRSRPC